MMRGMYNKELVKLGFQCLDGLRRMNGHSYCRYCNSPLIKDELVGRQGKTLFCLQCSLIVLNNHIEYIKKAQREGCTFIGSYGKELYYPFEHDDDIPKYGIYFDIEFQIRIKDMIEKYLMEESCKQDFQMMIKRKIALKLKG